MESNGQEREMHTDGMGYTEREWETLWNSETATSTVHRAAFDDETFCEVCDQDVDYSVDTVNGTCGCGA
jgi:hypothetical protein